MIDDTSTTEREGGRESRRGLLMTRRLGYIVAFQERHAFSAYAP